MFKMSTFIRLFVIVKKNFTVLKSVLKQKRDVRKQYSIKYYPFLLKITVSRFQYFKKKKPLLKIKTLN